MSFFWCKEQITIGLALNAHYQRSLMSYYSQVVRLVLEEEGVTYRSREFDIHTEQEQMTEWYIKINPNAVVPTLMHR